MAASVPDLILPRALECARLRRRTAPRPILCRLQKSQVSAICPSFDGREHCSAPGVRTPTVRRASAKPARSACRRRSPTRFTTRSACASRNCRSPPRRSTARYAGRRNDERRASDDLVGHVLGQEEWEILSFPAIAEKDEEHRIEMILEPRCFARRHGEALHPDREPLEVLDRIRRTIGEYNFAGQTQANTAHP